MKVTIMQLDPMVGDIDGNLKKLTNTIAEVEDSDFVVFPELFITGYPPRDLLEKPWFIRRVWKALEELEEISKKYPKIGILVGAPTPTGKNTGRGLYNSAVLIYQGKMVFTQHKTLLPTYDVFDEARYFDPAPYVDVIPFKGEVLGISICEDAWNDPKLWPRGKLYTFDPIDALAKKGATLFLNISASPFYVGKEELRFKIIRDHTRKHRIPFIYVNQVGGNDELIFDGRSFLLNKFGEPVAVLPSFKESVKTVDLGAVKPSSYTPQDKIETVYDALVLGIRDYMRKCGFSKAVVGLSGGIDSSVTCCLACTAIGCENVLGISMPSIYSSESSVADAQKLARNLGIQFKVIPTSKIYQAYLDTLSQQASDEISVTEENIQARIRGNILMAFSNKFGYLVLSTGNKSELATGYCTLYGDLSGGLAVLADVPKTMVYELAHYINSGKEIIPKSVLEKPPSAELRPDQKDQDTLPPYPVLDKILHYYLEEELSPEEIIELGFEPDVVRWTVKAIVKSEYKRRQAPLGLKVTTKAFGIGRRMPIAAKYE